MEITDSLNGNKNMDNDKWSDSMIKEERDRRSRSPMDKKMNRSRDSSTNRNNNNRQNNNSRNNRSRSPRGRRTRAPTNRRIYVANIPYDCKWTVVKDLFREKVGDVSYVELFEDEGGKFRGCGIVEFKDSSSVQKAVDSLHRYDFKGRQLVVKEDFDVDRDKTGKPLGRVREGGGGGGGGGRGGDRGGSSNHDRDRDDYGSMGGLGSLGNNSAPQYNTYGLSPQFLDALGITGPLTSRVFVANLDYKVSTQKLEEVFRLAGKVVKIDLKRDEEGNSKGHGTIEMGHPVEAVQAISMFNGQKFYNRTMSVRMDKKHQDDPEDKRLPEGLQSVGKGLGANGLPLHLSNSSGVSPPGGLPPVGGSSLGGLSAGSLSLMSGQLPPTAASATGIPGLSGIGMSLQERGSFSSASLMATNSNVGLGNSLMAGGLGGMSGSGGMASGLGMSGSGLGVGGLGGLGGSLGLGASSIGAGGGGLGYGDYERSFDRGGGGGGGEDYRSGRSSDTIVVRNLPVACTWENVRDRFRDFGDVQSTEMKGRGVALVRFNNERDAARAVDRMRGSRFYNRVLDVSLY